MEYQICNSCSSSNVSSPYLDDIELGYPKTSCRSCGEEQEASTDACIQALAEQIKYLTAQVERLEVHIRTSF